MLNILRPLSGLFLLLMGIAAYCDDLRLRGHFTDSLSRIKFETERQKFSRLYTSPANQEHYTTILLVEK